MPYKDPTARKACAQRYYEKNKDKVKDAALRWKGRNPDAKLMNQAMMSSKARGIEFSIGREDIIIPEFCPYLGVRLTNLGGRKPTNISIDRIDNAKGYVPGNIQVISYLANRMKDAASIEEMLIFSRNVLKIHGE